MQQIIVDIRIDKDEWLRIYRGETNIVYAISRDGRSIQFPANIFEQVRPPMTVLKAAL